MNVIQAYRNYIYAIQCIVDHKSEYYSKHFKDFDKELRKELECSTDLQVNLIFDEMNQVNMFLFSTIESNLYRNYKAIDGAIIKDIPFILTFPSISENQQNGLLLAYEDAYKYKDQNEILFCNVASATVLQPSDLHYIYYIHKNSDVQHFINTVNGMLLYFNDKINIHLHLYCDKDLDNGKRKEIEGFKSQYQKLKIYLEECKDKQELLEKIDTLIQTSNISLIDASTKLFIDDSSLQTQYEKMIYKYKCFKYNWKTQNFYDLVQCDELSYIHSQYTLRIENMLHLMNVDSYECHLPVFEEEYLALWNIFIQSFKENQQEVTNIYYDICNNIKEHLVKKQFRLVSKECLQDEMVMILPDYVANGVKAILTELKNRQIVCEKCDFYQRDADTWCLELISNGMYALTDIVPIFNQYHYLANVKSISFKQENQDFIVEFITLEVKDYIYNDEQKQILDQLVDLHFIRYIEDDSSKKQCSFMLGSYPIQRLLTNGSEIIRCYVYYEVKRLGYFDDLVSGYECSLKGYAEKNELDCIMTKGFSSMFVECEKPDTLLTALCKKLDDFADYFGIYEKKVIVAPFVAHDKRYQEELSQLHNQEVIVIYQLEDIKNIGNILISIMETNDTFFEAKKTNIGIL